MRELLIAATGLVALVVAAPAIAADMPPNARPMVAPALFNWTGFYIGANVGGTWFSDNASYFEPATPGRVIGGGQVGANWQTGMFVLGVEADIDGRHLDGNGSYFPFAHAKYQDTQTQQEDWVGTVRGRLGIVTVGKALFYATGGLAYGGLQHSYSQMRISTGQNLGLSDSTVKTGWTVGGGNDYAVTNNVSIGVEYLYVDLGATMLSLPTTIVSGGLKFPPSSATFSDRSDIVRARLNWRFGNCPFLC
jgi:outer membrane immunogenic protein